jgi:Ca-activated chloride channel homolog
MAILAKRRGKGVRPDWNLIPAVLVVTIITALASTPRSRAQQATPPAAPTVPAPPGDNSHPEDNDLATKPATIRATVELVNVPVTAKTKHGQRVIDLNQDEVKILEDGVEQKITHFERETRTPLRIGLIIDTSNSARRSLSYEKEAARQFTDSVLTGGTRNQAFLETFDASSSIVQDFTGDPDLMSEKIEGLKSGGGKALYDAIHYACQEKMLKTGPREEVRRILIVVSDGLDVQSRHTLNQVISMARMAETMIFTVGTAPYGFANSGDELLEQMSTETGGYPSFPLRDAPGSDLESGYLSHNQIGSTSQNKAIGAQTGDLSMERLENLAVALQAIGKDLDQQYNIAYKPLRDAMDGTYRSITVETTRRGVTLRWKPGYFARAE